MTKKDYVIIGKAIAEWASEYKASKKQFEGLFKTFSYYLKIDNPKFDEGKLRFYINNLNYPNTPFID